MSSPPQYPPPAGDSSGPRRLVMGLDRAMNGICALAMGISALAILASLFMVGYSVITRYFFNSPSMWVDDTVGFLLVAVVMFSAADALRRGEHIGVDVFTARLSGRAKQIAAAWGMLAVLVAVGFLAWDGWNTAMFSRMLGILTTGHVEVPVYLLQLMLPVGGVLMALAALVALARVMVGMPAVDETAQHLDEVAE